MFLVCGEALMDVFNAGATPAGVMLDARMGGSPFNVAVGLARLGQPCSLLTCLSRGFLGERLWQALETEGVGTAAIERVDAPTTLSLVNLNAQGLPSYSFYGQGGADRLASGKPLPADVRVIHLGSYTTVVEPVASSLRALVEQRRQAGTLVSFDPNIRLTVEPDVGRWRDMLRWMLPRTHLLKISDEDLALLGEHPSPEDFSRVALEAGVRLVVVTRGGQGAIAWTQRYGPVDVPCGPINLIDTVGAGDTFQAALLTWLAEAGLDTPEALETLSTSQLRDAVEFACLAASVTCSRRGADLPRRADLPARTA